MAQITIKEAICEAVRQTVNYIKGKAVTSDVQTFTDEEKAQIRANIGVTSDGNTDTSGITAEINALTNNVGKLQIETRAIYGKLEYSVDNNELYLITNCQRGSIERPCKFYGFAEEDINISEKAKLVIKGTLFTSTFSSVLPAYKVYKNNILEIILDNSPYMASVQCISDVVWGADIDYNISNLKENVTPVRKFYGTTNTAITEQVKVVTIEDTDFPTSVSDYYEGMRLSVKFTQNCNGTLSNTSTIKLEINGTARYVRDRDGGVTVSKAGISFGSNKYVDFVWDGIDAWVCYDVSEAHTEDMRMSTSSTKCKYNNLPATRDDVNNVYDLIKPVQITENVIFYTSWSGATIVFDKIYQNVPMVTAYVDTSLNLVTSYNPEVRIVGVTNTVVMIVYKASSEKSFDIKINVIGY